MKLIASIIAVMVLFLSTNGMVIKNLCQNKLTSAKKCCSKKGKLPARDASKSCNPFMPCSGTVYIATENEIKKVQRVEEDSIKEEFHDGYFAGDFVSSFWHPPESSQIVVL